jgi:hypothetical protein
VDQTEDYHPPPPAPAAESCADPSKADLVPTGTNPFEKLRGHNVMQALKAALVPWLIAEYGIDFASWDHVDVATEIITHIITKQQLGQYTSRRSSRTFAAIVDGHRVQSSEPPLQSLFCAKPIISFFCFCSILNNSSHSLVRHDSHCPSQPSSHLSDKVLLQAP